MAEKDFPFHKEELQGASTVCILSPKKGCKMGGITQNKNLCIFDTSPLAAGGNAISLLKKEKLSWAALCWRVQMSCLCKVN